MDMSKLKKVSYEELQTALQQAYKDADTNDVSVAYSIGVTSTLTIRNAFDTEKQKVSDEVMTGIFKNLGFNGLIVWEKGERNYYVPK